jgi:hypothetical protein
VSLWWMRSFLRWSAYFFFLPVAPWRLLIYNNSMVIYIYTFVFLNVNDNNIH